QPRDEERLAGPDEPAEDPIDAVQDTAPEPVRHRAPDRPADRFPEPDDEQDPGEDDDRPCLGRGVGHGLLHERQADDPQRPAAERPDEAADLGKGPRPDADENRDYDEDENDDVEEMHRPEVWPSGLRRCADGAWPPSLIDPISLVRALAWRSVAAGCPFRRPRRGCRHVARAWPPTPRSRAACQSSSPSRRCRREASAAQTDRPRTGDPRRPADGRPAPRDRP